MTRRAFGSRLLATLIVATVGVGATGLAQDDLAGTSPEDFIPKPTKEHERFSRDVGVWDASIKSWMQGPDAEPLVSTGVERNHLLPGGLWLISSFEGDFAGLPFQGHGQTGYDPRKGKYVGTWVDTLNTSLMTIEGSYDESTESLTMIGEFIDPSGQRYEQQMVTSYEGGGRVMRMSVRPQGSDEEFVRMMEITYTKRSGDEPAK